MSNKQTRHVVTLQLDRASRELAKHQSTGPREDRPGAGGRLMFAAVHVTAIGGCVASPQPAKADLRSMPRCCYDGQPPSLPRKVPYARPPAETCTRFRLPTITGSFFSYLNDGAQAIGQETRLFAAALQLSASSLAPPF